MLAHLSAAMTVALLLLNLAGLALVGHRVISSYALAKVVSPLLLCLGCFFVEHFFGLGKLSWLWPLTTLASVWMVLKHRSVLRSNWATEAVFTAGFGYSFLWRYCLPDIDAGSEKLADLTFICNYLPGATLPPVDTWLPPFRFDVYYSFQHYSAALMGRILNLDPGTTYNLGICVIAAMTIVVAWATASLLCRKRIWVALVVAAFVVGGTGASQVSHLMIDNPALYAGMRFIGGTATPGTVTTPFGKWLVYISGVPPQEATELALETFSYLTYLGDYHPPLSGFFLLMLGLLCIVLSERECEKRISQAVLAATVPIAIISNGWHVVPQLLMIGAWAGFRLGQRRPPDWKYLAAGFLSAIVLVYPFLSGFAFKSLDYHASFRLVNNAEHTPVLLGLIVFWPVLVVVALQLLQSERNPEALWFCALWMGLLLLSEFIYVDDVYSGKFNRFNTVLKWWPAAYSGALLSIGAINLTSKSKFCRHGTAIVLGVVCLYAVDLGMFLVHIPKANLGRLDGAAWITADNIEKPILEFLKHQPPVTVLQRLEAGAFTPSPGLIMLAGQRAFLGWPEHEKLWRGQRADIEMRNAQVASFYRGELPDSGQWLVQNGIDHVLWLKGEYKLPAGTFDKISAQIADQYYWQEYYRAGDFRVGIWSRRKK